MKLGQNDQLDAILNKLQNFFMSGWKQLGHKDYPNLWKTLCTLWVTSPRIEEKFV